MTGQSWSERLLGGLKRTSERLGENLSGLTGKSRLDDDDLDRIEEALITADLGPVMAARIRDRLAERGVGLRVGDVDVGPIGLADVELLDLVRDLAVPDHADREAPVGVQ